MRLRSSGSSWHRTQVSPTVKALCVRTSCHTPPRATLTAVLVRSSRLLEHFLRCLKACVRRPVSRPAKSGLFSVTSESFGRIPLDLQISFLPSEELISTFPSAWLRHPSNPVRQDLKVPDGSSTSAFAEN
eukprot:1121763-Amphidinium_carterae.1